MADQARPGQAGWLPQAALLVGLVTILRLLALAFNRTDLFVDESQYWFWGQNLDFGYYSKPPLIAWVIRAATDLAGSDAPFWVRMPGAVFHGATALILAAAAARLMGPRAAFWTALSYATLPMAALGSLLVSTDTIMAPFFAGAILWHIRATEVQAIWPATMAGLLAGLACMAKYAGVYFLLGAALAALAVPAARLSRRQTAAFLVAFAVAVLPNVLWNLDHELTTLDHTLDNIDWVRAGDRIEDSASDMITTLHPAELWTFFGSQFAVFGPVLFAALIWAVLRPPAGRLRTLLWFSVPCIAIVCLQALLSQAYANWAVSAYFAGTILSVGVLATRAPRLLPVSLAVNGAVCLVLPALTVLAPFPDREGAPLLKRYVGRADLTHQIVAAAHGAGVATVVSANRDILADLFYTGVDSGLTIRALPGPGRPRNYYEQNFPLDPSAGPVIYVNLSAPVCAGVEATPIDRFDTAGGAYAKSVISAYVTSAECALANP
jgi:4-amino-4-deoxy-L-arabinose transferase-like glycosyltransferase